MGMPAANKRISDLIDATTGGKVLPFLNILNEGRKDKISHQRLNRLFDVDSRTGNWPGVPHEILEAIILKFPNVDAHWLVTGQKKEADANPAPAQNLLTLIETEAKTMQLSLERLLKASQVSAGSLPKQIAPVQNLGLGKKPGNKNAQDENELKGNVSKMDKKDISQWSHRAS